jgi:N6-L-threonylcarbamoyladenine synthase
MQKWSDGKLTLQRARFGAKPAFRESVRGPLEQCELRTGFAPMTLILGIESSCDETAAALVTCDREILAHRLQGQEAEHRPYGGVVPEIAARAHVEALVPLIEAALADAGKTLPDVDAIAATAGPGLIGGVMVGLVTAKALCHAVGKPLIAVNHLEGHALSPRLADPALAFPYLLLLVSGGHCQLLMVRGVGQYQRLATTIDDAAGEAFDKTAKLLGLGFPGGPAVEAAARRGDANAVRLPRPLLGSAEPHFSFAGLKSAVLRARDAGVDRAEDIAASFQQAVVDCLIDRTRKALGVADGATALVLAGGVAANQAVRGALEGLAAQHGLPFFAPPLWLCTDNAAMIGWAGIERFAAGLTDPLDVAARPRWPLDPQAETARGAGVKA